MFFSSKTKWLSLSMLGIIVIPVWSAVLGKEPSNYLKVDFLDVGQGDAIFIEAPNHNQVLIDGGPGRAVLSELGRVMPFYDREIDLIISTHPDSDHLSGLIEVLKHYKVDKILTTGVKSDTNGFKEWLSIIKDKNIQIAEFGQIIQLSKSANMYILSPFENLNGKEEENLNDTSIVSRLVYGDLEILFTGDGEKGLEKEMIDKNLDLKSNILKVGHHGSRNSTTEEFLKAVSPNVAVIQVGANNSYHHPHKEVLGRLAGIKIYRTDQDGRIEVRSDGKEYKIKTKK